MDLLLAFILAVGLSMDSFAVSLGCGLAERKISFRHATRIAFSLAAFQGILPVVGWFMGAGVKGYIEAFDHWVAFALLAYLGIKMIYESFEHEEEKKMNDIFSWRHILTLSVATSIDALVVGFSYALAEPGNIFWGALIIGSTTFLFSMLGIRIGKDVGTRLGKKVELLGGLILIGIGIKILIEHIFLAG